MEIKISGTDNRNKMEIYLQAAFVKGSELACGIFLGKINCERLSFYGFLQNLFILS